MYDNINRYTDRDLHRILGDHLGERYAAYRAEWDAVTPDNVPSFPIHLDLELNDLCNQRCTMCPRNEDRHPDINYAINTKSVLSFDDYRRIIDEGAAKGLRSINLGAFAEPLIHKRVWDMVAYARDAGIVDTRMITNGLLLDRCLDQVFDSGLVNLFVSVDAFSPETYASIRGHGFERVKAALQMVLDERERRGSVLPIVRVSLVDMKSNHGEIQDFVDYWGPRVDFIDIQVYDDFNVDIKAPFDLTRQKKWDCRSPFARLAVLSDGRVLPCCNFFGWNVPVGNIHGQTLVEVWTSDAVKGVRDGLLADSLRNCAICQRIC